MAWAGHSAAQEPQPWQMGLQPANSMVHEHVRWFESFTLWIITIITLFVLGLSRDTEFTETSVKHLELLATHGARLVVTLLHELARRKGRHGLATLCVSGGMGGALLLERT